MVPRVVSSLFLDRPSKILGQASAEAPESGVEKPMVFKIRNLFFFWFLVFYDFYGFFVFLGLSVES